MIFDSLGFENALITTTSRDQKINSHIVIDYSMHYGLYSGLCGTANKLVANSNQPSGCFTRRYVRSKILTNQLVKNV